jgi:hypothetical protein
MVERRTSIATLNFDQRRDVIKKLQRSDIFTELRHPPHYPPRCSGTEMLSKGKARLNDTIGQACLAEARDKG